MAATVLLVEDEPSNSLLVEVTLRPLGCETIVRANGIAGLDTARTHPVDLVILDIALPGMDGWRVLEALRNDPATAKMPVLVLTAHAGEESMIRAADGGADAYMAKPFSPASLRDSVRMLLERAGASQAS